jgi:OmpA-OmpF porin, OOP family
MNRISLLFAVACLAPAANLVVNPSFENTSTTPFGPGGFGGSAIGWTSGGGSPDIFTAATMVTSGRSTFQTPFDGLIVAGILNSPVVPGVSTNAQYEYLQTELVSELVAGETYRLSMWVAHADKSRRRAPDLGMHLSTNTAFNQPIGAFFLPITLTPTMNNPYGGLITSREWILFESIYTAAGGERYLTIGNFLQNNGDSLPLIPTPTFGTGYYFIDNVGVESAVPEPSTWATAAAALVAVALRRARRIKSAA